MKQFIIVGLGRFGSSVAKTLAGKECDVLAIDISQERIQEISNEVTHAAQLDATNEAALEELGVADFDVAVVSIGEDIQSNILATLLLKELGVNQVVVKASNQLHGRVLQKVGADRIVHPERDMGTRIANNLVDSNILEYIKLAPNYSVVEIKSSPKMHNRSLKELQLRSRFGVNVMGIKRGKKIEVSPRAELEIKPEDTLIVVGDNESLARLRQF
ncbi:K+ transport system, NAD-binding component [Halobacteroides halobius DSM 5150]|uniref:K+ transport system, NAD-binding component n=1 Tax=Halobacteroides halobius (strain ATCC 35273 / DSM 5150 / MD-1) TaxID=748449 RepID=L0KBQ0_HALHC|nr:TrkA family potassium uptake protein [Halobacteroides halobius]AGB41975.1 K+ transport system, NAD-binding component [Halobacteroides halobius DSM 5150]